MRLDLRALKVVKGVNGSREVVLGMLGKLSFTVIQCHSMSFFAITLNNL